MYIPRFYEEKDWNEIEQLIREFGFAILVSAQNQVPIATARMLTFHQAGIIIKTCLPGIIKRCMFMEKHGLWRGKNG